MARDVSGNYSLPIGINPVIPNTIIETEWANPTLDDIAAALSDSLSRSGLGGMLVPFKNADGAVGTPGISWVNEPTSGWYRAGLNDFRYSVGNEDIFTITKDGVELADGKLAIGFNAFNRVQDDEPTDPPPHQGEQWYESDSGGLYMRYKNPDDTFTWILVNGVSPEALGTIPPGIVQAYAGPYIPAGWLRCDGSSYAVASYPALFEAIGYTYGGAGATFQVPSMGSLTIIGTDGSHPLSTTGGSSVHTLSLAEMPTHDHGTYTTIETANHTHSGTTGIESDTHGHAGTTGIESADHSHNEHAQYSTIVAVTKHAEDEGYIPGDGFTGGVSANHTHDFITGAESSYHTHSFTSGFVSENHSHAIYAQGGGGAHNNMQPFMALNYIIKA